MRLISRDSGSQLEYRLSTNQANIPYMRWPVIEMGIQTVVMNLGVIWGPEAIQNLMHCLQYSNRSGGKQCQTETINKLGHIQNQISNMMETS